jgi:hypothetical protein
MRLVKTKSCEQPSLLMLHRVMADAGQAQDYRNTFLGRQFPVAKARARRDAERTTGCRPAFTLALIVTGGRLNREDQGCSLLLVLTC